MGLVFFCAEAALGEIPGRFLVCMRIAPFLNPEYNREKIKNGERIVTDTEQKQAAESFVKNWGVQIAAL